MPTTDRPRRTRRSVWLTLLVATVTVLTLAAAVAAADEPDTAAGLATGGLAVVVAVALLTLRQARRPDRAGTAHRLLAHQGDERDNRIVTASLAITGAVATAATSFVVIDRRS